MKPSSHLFKTQAAAALADPELQRALRQATTDGFAAKRAAAVAAFPEFEALRERGRRIKDHALRHLDVYLARFAAAVETNGGRVHWAEDAATACSVILDICRQAGAAKVVKSKTMVGEEIGLNPALEAGGLEVVETDLGEYIIQLAGEPPSHIIAPAIHKTREQIGVLFDRHHHGGRAVRPHTVPNLVDEARHVLRGKFLEAEVGITGANFLVAETGTVVLVTNEGNADLSLTLPDTHIVVAGIEKVVPTLADATTLLRLLARSATGQEITTYTTFVTGARREGETDGPRNYHVVLVDNGRSRMLADEFREMLRCIRCGACMNHCPVYSAIGGHAYGWVYPGPMGSVLTPRMIGLDTAYDLPNACTLNGRCRSVCPVQIPLPALLRRLREQQFERGLGGKPTRWALRAWAWLARRPRLYQALTGTVAGLWSRLPGKRGAVRRLPFAAGWTASRDLPTPTDPTFLSQWRQKGKRHHD